MSAENAVSAEADEQFLHRAIRLAMNGRGCVEPNPMVGCVLVKDGPLTSLGTGRVIGEGHTQPFGGPHAEPTALANCEESPAGATAYVTLEPCCHTNKKTPPCVPRLIEAKIARVVYGCLDPNPDVNGKGVAMLRAAGIQVDGPVLESAAKQLIAPFIAKVNHRRPYVTLKWAETANGKVAGARGKRIAISGTTANRHVHHLRSRCDAIVVGIGTVVHDDPVLTTRGVPILRDTTKVVLDTHLRTPPWANVLDVADTLIYASTTAPVEAERRLVERRALVRRVPTGADGHVRFEAVLRDLFSFGHCTHVLVEPGPNLAASLFEGGWVDRLWVIRSPIRVDDPTSLSAAALPTAFQRTESVNLASDTLTEYLNPASPVFFAPEPSADFVLARDAQHT